MKYAEINLGNILCDFPGIDGAKQEALELSCIAWISIYCQILIVSVGSIFNINVIVEVSTSFVMRVKSYAALKSEFE